jgi:hypothetical protein
MIGLGAGTWATMQKKNRNAVGIAAFLYINLMNAAGVEKKSVVRNNFGIEIFHYLS